MIHPTAIVEPGAKLGADCEIHAYAVIKSNAELGDRVVVHPFAVIGGDPQFLKFDPATPSGVRVGHDTVIREHVTINRAIHAGAHTVVGAHCFLMATSHVAHDCAIADGVVLANAVLLAGHVTVGENTFLGGSATVHQFVRIGEGAMVGGAARISRDLAPYTMTAERDEVAGLNVVGLKRRGVPREAIRELKAAFHHVYGTPGNIRTLAAQALGLSGDHAFRTPEARRFLEFFSSGKRSFARPVRGRAAADEAEV